MPPPELFDSHFHLYPEDDAESLVARARENGVAGFLAAAGNLGEARFLAQLAPRLGLFYAAGVHPHAAAEFDGDIAPFQELILAGGAAAVGEIGLDYHYNHSPPAVQRRVFGRFLALARECDLPVVVHCREAEEDCYAILRDAAVRPGSFVVHSFTGAPVWAERFLDLGAFLSFNGIITFRRADNVREILRLIPEDRMLAETDSPYLAPVPHRGRRNEPALVRFVVQRMAEERNLPFAEIARLTTANAHRFLLGAGTRE